MTKKTLKLNDKPKLTSERFKRIISAWNNELKGHAYTYISHYYAVWVISNLNSLEISEKVQAIRDKRLSKLKTIRFCDSFAMQNENTGVFKANSVYNFLNNCVAILGKDGDSFFADVDFNLFCYEKDKFNKRIGDLTKKIATQNLSRHKANGLEAYDLTPIFEEIYKKGFALTIC